MEWELKTVGAAITGLVGAIAAARSWIAAARRSRLVDRHAFELPPVPEAAVLYGPRSEESEELLVGRKTDVDNLSRALRSKPLVFVEGPSGVGKSTLLKLGVARRLSQTGVWLPVYIEIWGTDWESGPRQALADALQLAVERGLPAEQRDRLGLEGAVTEDDWVNCLERLGSVCGRRPILFFDQLDDYQSSHWSRFTHREDNTVLSAEGLTDANSFWREVRDLLQRRALHCVFAVRRDSLAAVLRPFSFEEPEVFEVQRLDADHVRATIARRVGEVAVAEPENGFRQLVHRLAKDLSESDQIPGVLPIQMRVVLSGLRGLRRLTPADLDKAGGIEGLEAAYLESHLRPISGGAKAGLATLRLLVRRSPESMAKTDAKTALELATARGIDEGEMQLTLRALEESQILRRRWDPSQGEVWQLYHDYLAPAVVRLDRKKRRWEVFLSAQGRAFEHAVGWRKIGALLGPWSLLRLVFERLRGRLKLRPQRALLAWSAPRLVLNWGVVLAIGFLLAGSHYRVEERAQQLARAFDVEGKDLWQQEVEALWDIATAPPEVRAAVLRDFLESPVNAQRLIHHRNAILAALSGWSFEIRDLLIDDVLGSSCYRVPPAESRSLSACVASIHFLDGDRERVSGFVSTVVGRQLSDADLEWLTLLADRVETPLAERMAEKVLSVIEAPGDVIGSVGLERQAVELARQLGSPWPARVMEFYLADVEKRDAEKQGLRKPWWLAARLRELVELLDVGEVRDLAERLTRMVEAPRSYREGKFPTRAAFAAGVLVEMSTRLDPLEAAALARRLSPLLSRSETEAIRTPLILAAARLAAPADPTAVRALTPALADLFEQETHSLEWGAGEDFLAFCEDFNELAPHLDAETLEGAAQRLLERMGKEAGDEEMPVFDPPAECLGMLAEHVDPALPRQAVEQLLQDLVRSPEDPDPFIGTWFLENVGKPLGVLAPHLTRDEAGWVSRLIVDTILTSSGRIDSAAGLPALVERMTKADARALVDKILVEMEGLGGGSTDLSKLSALGAGLGAAARLLGEDSELFRQVLDRIRSLPRPPCAAAAPLAAESDLAELVMVLRWPTCLSGDGSRLIERIARLRGVPPTRFGSTDHGVYQAVGSQFIEWATEVRRAGDGALDLSVPLADPFDD